MGFIIAAVILTLGVLAILTFPWWRPNRVREDLTLSGEDLTVELDEDVATGALAAEDREPAARDLEATADTTAATTQRTGMRRSWHLAVVALLLVPLAAIILYGHFGNWRFALEGEHAAVVHRADTLIAQLQAHQRRHPDDVQGWINLGQGADALGRYSLAASAYEHAVKLKQEPDAQLLGLWGEALLLADPQNLTNQERQIFDRVLKLDPNNPRGLWYGGLLALDAGDRPKAIADWKRLLAQPGVPPQVAGLIRNHLRMLGAGATTVAQPAQAHTGAASLDVTIKLAPALKADVKPGETLYVFVRHPGGGPPLAVRRLKVTTFPVKLTLSDHDSMMQGHDLSTATGPLELIVHVSPQGDVATHPGDLLGSRQIKSVAAHQATTVVIDSRAGQAR
jgi:cytochrome c-type biogenesis protein CcmH